MQIKELIKTISKRLLSSIFVVFIIISLIFVLIRLAPGDPSQKFISPELSLELIESVKQNFQLDKPIYIQYVNFVWNLLNGDLGISYDYKKPVIEVIFEFLPFTIIFSIIVFTFQLIISFTLAFISMKLAGRTTDKALIKLNLFVNSLPVFVIGLILILIFSHVLNWLPISGLNPINNYDKSFINQLFINAKHLILPVITLSLTFIPVYFRFIRDNFDSFSNSAFILNLRANGLNDRIILLKHIIPNSINPLLAIAGYDIGLLLSGSLITEVIFALPGMGRLAILSIFSRDYPIIIGCCILSSIFMILANICTDILRSLLDKRNNEIILS